MTSEVNETPQLEEQPDPIAQTTLQLTTAQLSLLVALTSIEDEAVNPPKGEVTLARKQKLYEIMSKRGQGYSPSSLLKQLLFWVASIETALIVESYHTQITYYECDQVTHVSFTQAIRAAFPTALIYEHNGKDYDGKDPLLSHVFVYEQDGKYCSLWHLFVTATDEMPSTETLWNLVKGPNQHASHWQPYFVGERELVNFNPESWSMVP